MTFFLKIIHLIIMLINIQSHLLFWLYMISYFLFVFTHLNLVYWRHRGVSVWWEGKAAQKLIWISSFSLDWLPWWPITTFFIYCFLNLIFNFLKFLVTVWAFFFLYLFFIFFGFFVPNISQYLYRSLYVRYQRHQANLIWSV